MKFISNCSELNPRGTSTIIKDKDTFNEHKQQILKYLGSGTDAGVYCSVVVDRITGEHLPRTIHRYKDDEYAWTDEDIYHFKEYDIKLNDDFIEKVMKNAS